MADKKLISGGENGIVYRVAADHSDVVQADGTTVATTNAHSVLKFLTGTLKTALAKDKLTITTVKNDAELDSFIDTYVNFSASEVTDEVLFGEAGSRHSTSSGSSDIDNFLVITAGAVNGDGRKTQGVICSLDADAVAETWEYKKHGQRNIPWTLVNALDTLAIVNGLLPTGLYDGAATFTVASGRPLWKGYLAEA